MSDKIIFCSRCKLAMRLWSVYPSPKDSKAEEYVYRCECGEQKTIIKAGR